MRCSPALLLLLLIMLCDFQFARASEPPIVISANEHTTVALFFPAEIMKVIEPASHFKVSYVQNDQTATINGREGKPSNLTVITEDGRIYSFELKYAVKIETFTWIVEKEQAIGKTTPYTITVVPDEKEEAISKNPLQMYKDTKIDPTAPTTKYKVTESTKVRLSEEEQRTDKAVKEGDLYELERESYYEIFCQNNYLQEPVFNSSSENSSRIKLLLNNIQKDRNEIYFNVAVQNDSEAPYMLKQLLFFIKTKGEKSHMKLKPLFSFNVKKTIASGTKNTQMYVYKDFILGAQQELYVMVEEVGSSRVVVLAIDKEMNVAY